MDRAPAGLGADSLPTGDLFWRAAILIIGWERLPQAVLLDIPKTGVIIQAEDGARKTTLPSGNLLQILYQFFEFPQTLKQSPFSGMVPVNSYTLEAAFLIFITNSSRSAFVLARCENSHVTFPEITFEVLPPSVMITLALSCNSKIECIMSIYWNTLIMVAKALIPLLGLAEWASLS